MFSVRHETNLLSPATALLVAVLWRVATYTIATILNHKPGSPAHTRTERRQPRVTNPSTEPAICRHYPTYQSAGATVPELTD